MAGYLPLPWMLSDRLFYSGVSSPFEVELFWAMTMGTVAQIFIFSLVFQKYYFKICPAKIFTHLTVTLFPFLVSGGVTDISL